MRRALANAELRGRRALGLSLDYSMNLPNLVWPDENSSTCSKVGAARTLVRAILQFARVYEPLLRAADVKAIFQLQATLNADEF